MNDNFSFNRFWAYFTKLLVERWQTNKMRLAILFGSIAMIELWIAFATYSKSSSSTDKAVDILLDNLHSPLFGVFLGMFVFGRWPSCAPCRDAIPPNRTQIHTAVGRLGVDL